MLTATTFVAIVPILVSLWLRADGVISSAWVAMALSLALSAAASSAGNAYWSSRGSGDVLFSELLLWGWALRRRHERQLSDATELLGLVGPQTADGGERIDVRRHEQLLRQLADALEGQDLYLNGHSHRVARHAAMIARGMGLPSDEVARIRAAAAVHDVGKLRTPKEILNKPGRLTDEEFEVIKRHPGDGADMVAALGDPALTAIVRHHHERLDGGGYPDGLAGDQIPLGARIVAVADTFDAVTSTRAYRGAALHREAIAILRHESGAQLDPAAVRAFLSYYSGNRIAMLWAAAMAGVRRIVSWLGGDSAAASTLSSGKVAAALAASAAIAASSAVVPVAHLRSSAGASGSSASKALSAQAASGGQASAPATGQASATPSSAPAKSIATATARGAAHGVLVGVLAKASSTPSGTSVSLTTTAGRQIPGANRTTSAAGSHGTAPGVSSGNPVSTNPAAVNGASSPAVSSPGAPSSGASSPGASSPGASSSGASSSGAASSGAGASSGQPPGAVNHGHGDPHNPAGQGDANPGGDGQGTSNAGGQGKSNAGGEGQGNSNAGGQGQGNSNGAGQGQGNSNAGGQSQGSSNAGGQGQGSSSTGGQGQGGPNAGGQGKSNAGGQGKSTAGG